MTTLVTQIQDLLAERNDLNSKVYYTEVKISNITKGINKLRGKLMQSGECTHSWGEVEYIHSKNYYVRDCHICGYEDIRDPIETNPFE